MCKGNWYTMKYADTWKLSIVYIFLGKHLSQIWILTYVVLNLISLSTVVVMSHESNVCSLFASQACPYAIYVRVGSRPRNLLDTNHADIEKTLLTCDVTTKC